jgi:hypothetical protein
MFGLLPLLAVPFVIMLGFKISGGKRYKMVEFLAMEGGMILLLVCGFSLARCGAMSDVETWSGRVTAKDHYKRSCSHSYDCNCVCTSRDDDGNCESEVCQTCYDHSYDYFWTVSLSTGDNIMIESCGDCPRRRVPIWEAAYVGEPSAVPRRYTNYLQADPDSVLVQDVSALKDFPSPNYPQHYNYYKIDRAINYDTHMDVRAWNALLNDLNSDLGHAKQVNVIVIATTMSDHRFADHVEHEWLYGKKNDLIFVLGAPDGSNIEWARVVTISNVEMLKVKVRDELIGKDLTDLPTMNASLRSLVSNHFKRTPMAEFEYLASAAKPPTWAMVLLYILGILGSILGSLFMIANDF